MKPSRIIRDDEEGCVVLEWHIDGVYHEIEINGPFNIEWMVKKDGCSAVHYCIESSDQLKKLNDKKD